jgi:hypothetical protein
MGNKVIFQMSSVVNLHSLRTYCSCSVTAVTAISDIDSKWCISSRITHSHYKNNKDTKALAQIQSTGHLAYMVSWYTFILVN